MDAIGSLLDGPRARGAFLLKVELDPPWSMRIEDEAPLSLVILTRGTAQAASDGEPPQPVNQGDVVIARGPAPYTFRDTDATPPQVVIAPGPRCLNASGEPLGDSLRPGGWRTPSHGYTGVRTWGNTPAGATQLLVGTYQYRSAVGNRLTDALPPLAVLPGLAARSALFTLLGTEIATDSPGQDVVLDRLLDLLLVASLRAWFAQPQAQSPRWYVASADPVIGPAVRMIIADPARNWTVAALADAVNLSRAAFARRFADVIGEPPISFLTSWRLTMAADLLSDTDATVEAISQAVGYSSPFALSTAFKRHHRLSPQDFRRTARPDRAA